MGGEINFLKKRVGKNSSWVGEKNTLLKKLVVALACAFFKSVFFCALAFSFLLLEQEV